MKRNRLLSLIALAFVSLIILQSNSGGYVSAVVAPTSSPGCSGSTCHPGTSTNQNTLKIELFDTATNTVVTSYNADQTYEVKVSLAKTNPLPKAGMQFTAFDGTGNAVGSFPGINSHPQLQAVQSPKLFITHRTSDVTNIIVSSTVEWKFYWKAPLLGGGFINFSALGNDADGDFLASSTDIIRHIQLLIPLNNVSVKDFSKGISALYPNPTAGDLTVTLDSEKESNIHVYSVTGQLVKKLTAQGNEIKMDVSNLTTGNYFITIEQNDNTARTQFVKY